MTACPESAQDAPTTAAGARLPVIEGILVFEATWAGTIAQKVATMGFAATFWTIWLSLWLPAFTFFVWGAAPVWGLAQAAERPDDALFTLGLILATGLAMGTFLGLWGTVQMLSGRTRERPREMPRVTLEQLAESHQVDETMLRQAWQSRRLVIHHDDKGHVTDMELSLLRPRGLVLVSDNSGSPNQPEPPPAEKPRLVAVGGAG